MNHFPLPTCSTKLTVLSSTTVFVSSLAFNTTSASLEEAFADLAPVRNAFVVTQKDGNGEAKSKGVGFVSFAIQEDADQVMSKYKEGTGVPFKIDGRGVRIQWAKKKVSCSSALQDSVLLTLR